jgi:glutathione S-transferase
MILRCASRHVHSGEPVEQTKEKEGPVDTHTLTLYQHPFASFCWKALIALYELELGFRSVIVGGESDRAALSELWPLASIPVLRDETAELTLPQSSAIVEYLDGLSASGRVLVPRDPDEAIEARLWDRILDDYVAVPVQKIVGDSLRADAERDRTGVEQARGGLERAYALLDARLSDRDWAGGEDFSIADCAAAPALFYARIVHAWQEERLESLTRYYSALMHRPSIARVIDEARPYRALLPLAWLADADAHQPAR